MYTTPDEDRSDLFLAGAVFFLGPEIIGIVLRRVPIPAGIAPIVGLTITLATTVLVPILLIRYRKERIRDFGFTGPRGHALPGLVAALPVAAAYLVANVVAGHDLLGGVPLTGLVPGTILDTLIGIVAGLCVALLAIYTTIKARSAFSPDPRYIRTTVVQLGRFVGIAALVAAVLLFVTLLVREVRLLQTLEIFLVPAGVAAAVWVVYRAVQGSLVTSRATLITPMVIMAIGSLRLFAPAFDLVFGLWRGALLAGVGLALGTLLESKRSAWAPLGLAAGLVLLTPLLP